MAEQVQNQTRTVDAAWQVRAFAPGDEGGIACLFAGVFGRSLSVARYRWKVLEAPWSIGADTAWVAAAGGDIVGHYAGTPLRFKLGERELTILHVGDVMTAAHARRQGVLSAVGSAATRAWAAAGVPFLIGVPQPTMGSRREYLGWQKVFEAAWWFSPLHPESLLASRYPNHSVLLRVSAVAGRVWNGLWEACLGRAGRGTTVASVERVGPEFDALWAGLRQHYEALVVRDRAWLTYRYAQAPGQEYRILLAKRDGQPVGYLVYRLTEGEGRRTGWMVNLMTAPHDWAARAALLGTARRALWEAGAGKMLALIPRGSGLERRMGTAGFSRTAGSYDVSVVLAADAELHPALRDPTRWFVMAGDFDVV